MKEANLLQDQIINSKVRLLFGKWNLAFKNGHRARSSITPLLQNKATNSEIFGLLLPLFFMKYGRRIQFSDAGLHFLGILYIQFYLLRANQSMLYHFKITNNASLSDLIVRTNCS